MPTINNKDLKYFTNKFLFINFTQNFIEEFLMKGFIFLFLLFSFESTATFTSQRNDVIGWSSSPNK